MIELEPFDLAPGEETILTYVEVEVLQRAIPFKDIYVCVYILYTVLAQNKKTVGQT